MHNSMLRLMLLALAASLLTACAMENSSPACTSPPIKNYDRGFQSKLAQEIQAAPSDAAFPLALQDYALLREQVRAKP